MYKIYQVEYGDTIDIIANKTNTTAENIKKINDLNSNQDLIVGGLIIVPKMEQQFFETYIVKAGDSIYSIAQMYDINPNTILMLNGLNKNDYIYPNQEILIPKGNVELYVTKEGDTIDGILSFLNIGADTLNKENGRILVLPDQLIVHKKEEKL